MKYILMMQFPLGDWKTKSIEVWPPQDVKAHMDFLRRFNKELNEALLANPMPYSCLGNILWTLGGLILTIPACTAIVPSIASGP